MRSRHDVRFHLRQLNCRGFPLSLLSRELLRSIINLIIPGSTAEHAAEIDNQQNTA